MTASRIPWTAGTVRAGWTRITPKTPTVSSPRGGGLEPLAKIAPNDAERAEGWFYQGKHLDMFWTFGAEGRSYLDETLKALDIDTIVIAGLWTDECVLSTAYAGSSRGHDLVVLGDAVATATDNHEIALKVAASTVAKVVSADDMLVYLESDFESGAPGAVKGTTHPDGRKKSSTRTAEPPR